MKLYYITTECKPFSKVGGIGDVAGELPVELKRQGVDVEIITPLFESVYQKDISKTKASLDTNPTGSFQKSFHGRTEKVDIYHGTLADVNVILLKNETWFEGKHSDLDYGSVYVNSPEIPFYDDILRFSFFSEACLQFIKEHPADIVHVNDWALSYLLGKMKMENLPARRVLTIHNIGYQGNIGKETIQGWEIEKILNNPGVGPAFVDPRPEWKSVNALRLGLETSHIVNTVSPNYCLEMTKPEDQKRYFEGGKGLDKITSRLFNEGKLIGILNGFDYKFDSTPQNFKETLSKKKANKDELSVEFAEPGNMLLGFVGRAVEQKFKLLTEELNGKSVLEHILDIPGINVAILATGLPEYESFMAKFIGRPNCQCTIAFDKNKAQKISLGSDLFLMPSLFEPCGITQMESLSNATPPLVRWTGGLTDTVKPHDSKTGTGFGFDGSTKKEVLENLIKTVQTALVMYEKNSDQYKALMEAGFKERFTWVDSVKEYITKIYEPLMKM